MEKWLDESGMALHMDDVVYVFSVGEGESGTIRTLGSPDSRDGPNGEAIPTPAYIKVRFWDEDEGPWYEVINASQHHDDTYIFDDVELRDE